MKGFLGLIEEYSPVIGLLSFIFSFVSSVFSFQIKKKINNAKSEVTIKYEKEKLIEEIDAFLVFLKENEYSSAYQNEVKTYIIDIEAKFPLLEKKCKKHIENINKNIQKWEEVRSSLGKIKSFINGV